MYYVDCMKDVTDGRPSRLGSSRVAVSRPSHCLLETVQASIAARSNSSAVTRRVGSSRFVMGSRVFVRSQRLISSCSYTWPVAVRTGLIITSRVSGQMNSIGGSTVGGFFFSSSRIRAAFSWFTSRRAAKDFGVRLLVPIPSPDVPSLLASVRSTIGGVIGGRIDGTRRGDRWAVHPSEATTGHGRLAAVTQARLATVEDSGEDEVAGEVWVPGSVALSRFNRVATER